VNPTLAAAPDDEEPKGSKKGRQPKPKRNMSPKRADRSTLTAEEKLVIASAEIDVFQASMEHTKSTSERQLDELRALMEETDLRIAETKKDTYEFKRDIVVGAENYRTGKTMAEKMVRYMEEKLRAKDTMIEKLRLKNVTLKTQIQKMEQQLQQKEEMGEVLHVIDFDQLKIENQQYLEKIEERNNELLRLKLTTGKTVQVLNNLKMKLASLNAQGEWLHQESFAKQEQLARFEEDVGRVTEEKVLAEKLNKMLRAEQEDSERPQVVDYIKLKVEVHDLEKKCSDWLRKNEIVDMEQARMKATIKQVSLSHGGGVPLSP